MSLSSKKPSRADEVTELVSSLRSADGVLGVDHRQRISHWSSSAEQMLGYTAQEVVGQRCYEVLGLRHSQNARFCRRDCPVITNARRCRVTPDYDVIARTKDGRDVWINISILLLKTNRSRSPVVVHLMRDVTERRRVEGLARRAGKALRELTVEPEEPTDPASRSDPLPAPLSALSRRELQVLQLLAGGQGTRQIANSLGIRPITARNHITHVISKLGARNRMDAVLDALRRGLI